MKLSASQSVNVRMGALREKIDRLSAQTGRTPSEICRAGLMAYWPEIEALNQHLSGRATEQDIAELRGWIDAGRQAKAMGIDLPALIRRELVAA